MNSTDTLPSRPLPRLEGTFANVEARHAEATRLATAWVAAHKPHYGRAQRRAYIGALATLIEA